MPKPAPTPRCSLPDPTNYGRVTRDADGHVTGIVEERDATDPVKQIDEICTGVYAFDAAVLRDALERIHSDNAQQEEYLTDVIGPRLTGFVLDAVAHFVDGVTLGQPVLATGQEGLENTRLISALLQAANRGTAVPIG